MAEVFEAELAGELGFVRKVAIKRMLGAAAADVIAAKRFLDEATIASRLHHANIVSVLDVGLLDGLPFQVLELVDGSDAQALQARAGGTFPLEIALIIANGVAHALDHAHNATDANKLPLGIVHRDVKPSNVLVSWGGDVKLTDFGIAVAFDRASKTEAGIAPGTMGYMAPEQRTQSEVDGRTDVFALGLALHAMIAGYTPLRDITVEMAALEGEPIPIDASIPADVRLLIERAIAPRRADRLTAVQLADAIGAALAPRLTRDPKTRLRSFLSPLHDSRPRPGALDALLGLDVVLSRGPDGDEPPRYELRETSAGRPSNIATKVASDERPTVAKRSPAPIAIGALAVLALGGGAIYLTTRDHPAAAVPRVDAGAVAVAADARIAEVPRDAEAIVVARDAAVVHVTIDAGVHVHHASRADAGAPLPTGTGYVQITGEANIGAQIMLDGRAIGHAPDKLAAPLGKHTLEIVRPDGTRESHPIEITEYHTLAHPAHF